MVRFLFSNYSSPSRRKVHKVLVKDRLRRIRFQEGPEKITSTDRGREMRPLDLAKLAELENVSPRPIIIMINLSPS